MSKKGENIYKRRDNRWEARYVKGYHPNGMARYGYCYGKTYREAKQKVIQAKAALLAGKPNPSVSRKRRFAFYCDEWLWINRSRVKESTYVKYSTMLENHIKPKLGGCLVQSLTSVMVEEFSHELLYDHKLAPKTVKDILSMLHSVLKYTAKQFPEGMPMIEIVYPKDPKKEMRVLSREEQTLLVRYLLRILFLLLTTTATAVSSAGPVLATTPLRISISEKMLFLRVCGALLTVPSAVLSVRANPAQLTILRT